MHISCEGNLCRCKISLKKKKILWFLFRISTTIVIDHALRVSSALHIKKFEKHWLGCQLSSGMVFLGQEQHPLWAWVAFHCYLTTKLICSICSLYLHETGQLSCSRRQRSTPDLFHMQSDGHLQSVIQTFSFYLRINLHTHKRCENLHHTKSWTWHSWWFVWKYHSVLYVLDVHLTMNHTTAFYWSDTTSTLNSSYAVEQ